MKSIKHLFILMLAVCFTYQVNAQCPTQVSVSVSGNSIAAKTAGSADAYLYAWYLDGAHVAGPGLDTFYTFQNVLAGTHRVCVYAYQSNSGNFCDSVCESAVVTSCGTLTAQWTDIIGNSDSVTFTAYDTNSLAHHIFNFGDGTSASGTSIKHVYSAPGTYHVCFYSYIPGTTCSDSLCENVIIPTSVQCDSMVAYWTSTLTARPGGGSNGAYDSLFVTAVTDPAGTIYSWTFGDGSSSSSTFNNASHDYFTNGTYSVCLIVSNPGTTCRDTFCNTITVSNVAVCGTANLSTYILNDSTIRAYSTSTGTNDSTYYVWNVYLPNQSSDGTPIQTQNTGHTSSFLSNALPIGNYRVCLSLYSAPNVFCDSFCTNAQVLRCSSLNAQWSYTSSTANDTLKVAAPTNNPAGTTFAWTFGDGSTSSSPGLTHVYSQSGVYTVCLVVSNPALTCKDTLCQSITIGNPNACGTASFEYYVLNDSTIRGYSTSTGTSDSSSYVWNIYSANGGLITSYNSGHTNNYLSGGLPIGTYRVCLDLYNASGAFCDSSCNSIQILRCSSINAAWQYTSSTANDTAKFYSSNSSPSGTVFAWTFGDGSTSSLSSPVHVYAQSGVYTVCLVVSNPALTCKDTLCQSITVGNPNACGTASYYDYVINDSTILCYSNSTGTSDSSFYVWNVYGPNGNLVQTSSTGHSGRFLSNSLPIGTYKVCLDLYNAQNLFCDSFCSNIQILRCSSLSAAWTYTSSTANDTLKVAAPTSNPSGTTFAWTFGDGSTSSLASVNHVYSQAGTYTVCLIVSNPALTCHDTLCQSVTVGNANACGVASFEYYVLNDSTIRCYSNSTGTTDSSSYVWYISYTVSGLPVLQTISTGHTNNLLTGALAAGSYKVCLYLYNALGAFCDSSCNTIQVLRCSSLNAQYSYTVSTNDSVKFSAPTNNPSGTTFAWTFGDGTTSSLASLTHVYAQAGTYTACLIVSNPALTCHDTLCQSVTATGSNCGTLTAYWNSPTPVNDTARFTAYDTVSAAHHIWNFGDGTDGSGTTATHVYAAPGTYTVCFYSYIPGTTCSDSLCRSVVIPSNSCGTASFSYYIYGDTSIHAYSTSTGTGNSSIYKWTIAGANGNIIQTQTNDTNYIRSVSLAPGVYTVCLYLYNGSILCNYTCSSVVIPIAGACGTAAFADTVYPGIGGGAIHAYTTATNVDSMAQYSWKIWSASGGLVQTFTGGDFTSSTLDSGTYTVCQYIRATASTYICDSVCHTVVVGGGSNPCAGLSAAWTYSLVPGTTDSVQFTGTNGPANTYYRWTFGDGSYNYGQTIVHGYSSSGTYDVCLEVFIGNNSTCQDTSCRNIVITTTTPCPVAAFSDYVYGDTSIHAYSSSTGATASTVYNWKVTNSANVVVATSRTTGTTSSFLTPALPNGTYNVCLYVSANSNTYCDSVCHTITVYDSINPCAGLNATFTETHLNNGDVQFTELDSAAGLTHYWHFGDGTISTGPNPVHAYATAGLYHVCQYVFYAGSTCLDSFCTNVQAGASGCNANFSTQGYYPPYNGVHFTNLSTSTDSIISYRWTFGDSTDATFASGDHVFPHSGTWYVCLSIYAANGCSSTYCDSVKVSYDPCSGLSAAYTYTYTQSGGVHFAGSTSVTNATNYWTFGDGTTATTFDPTHYYTQPGTYTVCHITSIPGTLCSDTTCQSIQGTGVGTSCHADFSDSTSGNEVYFTNTSTSTDSITSYSWSFGDGSGSSNRNAAHIYSTPGTYYACLTINSANGCSNTYCDSVHAGTNVPACHASFTYTVDSCQLITFTSTSTGSLDFLRWIYGDGTTDTLSHPTHQYAQGGYYTVILHFYGNGCYNFDTAVIYVPSCATVNDTVCGIVFEDLNGNGVQNTGEPGVASAEVHIGNYVTYTDSTGHYWIVVPGGSYTIYYCAPAGYTYSIPVHSPYSANATCASYTVPVGTGSNCGYNFGILVNSTTICGTVYFDANDNHVQDQSESGIPNAQVIFTSSGQVVYTGYTDQYGHYCAVLPAGTYVITVGNNTYSGGVVTPNSITVAAAAGGAYDNNNFGVYVAPGSCDLAIKISPNTTITPGYPAWYQIQVCNVGPVVTSGIVNLFYDPSLKFNYGSPVPTSQNSTTYTASWDLNNLNPGSCQYYYVSLTADSNLVTGQFIFTLANVTTNNCNDANLANNVDTLHQNVTASWDPNNKQVSPVGVGPQGAISGDQYLTYTISFQNTGTAPAVNIVVEDTLSANLNVSTFKMLGSSLPCTMQLAGNEAIWKFNGVMLPDSSTDQQGSHGYVTFMIQPVQGLPGNTQITNQADIFFDYNAGVSTNQTLNTIDYTLSVAQIAADNVTITLQPNPFSQYTTIKIDGTEGPYQLNVYDMLGRVVKIQTAAGNVFDVDRESLASGMYMYEVMQQGKVIGKGKMIAQ